MNFPDLNTGLCTLPRLLLQCGLEKFSSLFTRLLIFGLARQASNRGRSRRYIAHPRPKTPFPVTSLVQSRTTPANYFLSLGNSCCSQGGLRPIRRAKISFLAFRPGWKPAAWHMNMTSETLSLAWFATFQPDEALSDSDCHTSPRFLGCLALSEWDDLHMQNVLPGI